MRARGILDDGALEEMMGRIEAEIDDALASAEASPYPDPATLREGVYAKEADGAGATMAAMPARREGTR
jgi:pyruvate dehydrogenase E1 component alpha subunit